MKVNKKVIYSLELNVQDNLDKKEIDFLVDLLDPIGNRRSGRTYKMAIAFISLALKYPNQKIKVFDHIKTSQMDRYILDQIEDIVISKNLRMFQFFKNQECAIKFVPQELAIPNSWTASNYDNSFGRFIDGVN